MILILLFLLCGVGAGYTCDTSKHIDADSVLTLFEKAWEAIEDYECTFESRVKKGKKSRYGIYEYKFKKPKWIFIKIIDGKNKGAKIVYNPNTKKVRACKGGVLSFIKITAKPTDKKVLSMRGNRIDESHWGAIFKEGSYTLESCEQRFVGKETFEGRETWIIEFTTSKPEANKDIAKERFWIDQKIHLLLKFEQWDKNDVLMSQVIYRKIKINTGIGFDAFKL